jgi:hypothetical protein
MILTVAVSFFGVLLANAAAQTGKPATPSELVTYRSVENGIRPIQSGDQVTLWS